jgi:hypothetical protein
VTEFSANKGGSPPISPHKGMFSTPNLNKRHSFMIPNPIVPLLPLEKVNAQFTEEPSLNSAGKRARGF